MYKKTYYTLKRLKNALANDEINLNSNFVLYNNHYYLLREIIRDGNNTKIVLCPIKDTITLDLEEECEKELQANEEN